jgi:hypothetical protein
MEHSQHTKSIAVRLEGGIGDHILGMRVLPFIRLRYPDEAIIAYSDAAGHPDQLAIASMSRYISRVVPVCQDTPPTTGSEMGVLTNIRQADRDLMTSSEQFIDTYGPLFFAGAAIALDVPVFSILAQRTELNIPSDAEADARRLLARYGDARFVGLNLTKHGVQVLRQHESLVRRVLQHLLDDSRVIVLNFMTSSYDFSHWPPADRISRRQRSIAESAHLVRLCHGISHRIVPCVDVPLLTVAALLAHCRYFIGVDNGIKHMAWALDVPHTFLHTTKPDILYAARWIPDLHRILLFDCSPRALSRHLSMMSTALDR